MKIKSILLSVLALSALVACQEKQTILTPSRVALDPLIIKAAADGETKTAKLTANCEWEATGPAWVTVSPAAGNGDTTISLLVAANDGKERDGEVTITAKDAGSTAKLLVYQAGKAAEPGPENPDNPPTPEDPTVIKTAEGWLNFLSEASTYTAEETYSIEADIDCGGAKISPVSSFAATLDGKGHKVYNFSVESTDAKSGLVLVNTGTIKNVVFGSADGKTYDGKSSISAVEGAGGEFAGLVGDNAGTLENVTTFVTVNYVAGTEKPSDYIGVGGLAGTASLAGTFVNCTNYATFNTSGTLTQEMGIGGILGYTKSKDVTITSCVNAANLTITMPVAKDNGITLTNCKNSGTISSNLQQVNRISGILGTLNRGGTVQGCENSGDIILVQAEDNANWQAAGGIVGSQEREDAAPAKVIGNTNTGKISVTLANNTTAHQNRIAAGGIFGLGTLVTEVSGNTNKGDVSLVNTAGTADSWAGGIVGTMVSTTTDYPTALSGNVNEGAVSCKTADDALSAAGGVIGNVGYYPTKTDDTKITVTGDKNTGAVTCANVARVGSVAGYNVASLVNCQAGGSVNGTALTAENFATLIQGSGSSGSATGTTLAK